MKAIKPIARSNVFNVQNLQALTGGNPLYTQRLLEELLSSNSSDRKALLGIARSGNRQALTEAAHKIKGAARIVQSSLLIQRCEALEQACHEEQSRDRIDQCTMALERAMTELERVLETEIAKAK
jgi:two-component system sensor histidine kinase EvgS